VSRFWSAITEISGVADAWVPAAGAAETRSGRAELLSAINLSGRPVMIKMCQPLKDSETWPVSDRAVSRSSCRELSTPPGRVEWHR
jgi:hypothetical protein